VPPIRIGERFPALMNRAVITAIYHTPYNFKELYFQYNVLRYSPEVERDELKLLPISQPSHRN
jgi:hypothetical protein